MRALRWSQRIQSQANAYIHINKRTYRSICAKKNYLYCRYVYVKYICICLVYLICCRKSKSLYQMTTVDLKVSGKRLIWPHTHTYIHSYVTFWCATLSAWRATFGMVQLLAFPLNATCACLLNVSLLKNLISFYLRLRMQ